ncbi:MAG: SpoIVB peptidase [Clostridia bacterium]|nr:SpoIVB peptidase [Clostridia bacterium]
MNKKKAFLSFLSVFLSGVLLFGVFSASSFKNTAFADAKLSGVSGRLQKFGENIFEVINFDKEQNITEEKENITQEKVYLGGYPVGLKLYADGVVVVGTESVDTSTGDVNPAEVAGLQIGDIIKKVNGTEVNTNYQVSSFIEKSNGEELLFEVLRGEHMLNVNFKGAFSVSESKYKAGIWIRDSSAGIGTVTFSTSNGYFASLGHAVCDIDTKEVLPICQGECTGVNITGIQKGNSGATGELCGVLENDETGSVLYNGDLGVYGRFDRINECNMYPIAEPDEIKTGTATIFTTLENGVIGEYEIEIISIDINSQENKNLVLKVRDNNLIQKTGGIVQGMSGSPIIQNNKIVGAVTHVFLNDPTGGYGIFAKTMLNTLETVSVQQ